MYFFFVSTSTTQIYTLSLHDALPISDVRQLGDALLQAQSELRDMVARSNPALAPQLAANNTAYAKLLDRKSTRLNSSHPSISYAVFCLKKKKLRSRPLPSTGFRPSTR